MWELYIVLWCPVKPMRIRYTPMPFSPTDVNDLGPVPGCWTKKRWPPHCLEWQPSSSPHTIFTDFASKNLDFWVCIFLRSFYLIRAVGYRTDQLRRLWNLKTWWRRLTVCTPNLWWWIIGPLVTTWLMSFFVPVSISHLKNSTGFNLPDVFPLFLSWFFFFFLTNSKNIYISLQIVRMSSGSEVSLIWVSPT